MKNEFAEWYSQQVDNELHAGKKVEDINIQFKLTTIKPLYSKYLLDFYNHITSEAGSKIIVNGLMKSAGIYDAM